MNDSGIEISPTVQQQSFITHTPNANRPSNEVYTPNFKNIPEEQNEDEDDSDDDSVDDDEDVQSSKKSKDTSSLLKPPKPYLEIIADAILSTSKRMMQLHEIYNYMEKKYPYFAQNVNKSWRNSVRHNLSLNECFVKAGRGTNGKGNYWRIHQLCEPDFLRGNFRRKNFKQIIRSATSSVTNRMQQPRQHVYPDQSEAQGISCINPHFDAEQFLNTISANYNFNFNQNNIVKQHRFNAYDN
jgi:hypothetical protein